MHANQIVVNFCQKCPRSQPPPHAGLVLCTVIPEKFAVPGKRLKLTLENTTSSNWEVLGAGTELFPENLLVHQSQDYKRMRKASDI